MSVMEENHVINWDKAIVVDREAQRQTKWIKEAVWIRKTPMCMNRDAGSYQLSHTWDQVISRSREPSSCKQSRCDRDVRRTSKPGSFRGGTRGNAVPIVEKLLERMGTAFPLLKCLRTHRNATLL